MKPYLLSLVLILADFSHMPALASEWLCYRDGSVSWTSLSQQWYIASVAWAEGSAQETASGSVSVLCPVLMANK